MRIYVLAHELDINSLDLVEVVKKAGIRGKGSALASLTDDEVVKVKAFLRGGDKKADPVVATAHADRRRSTPVEYRREDYIAPVTGKGKALDVTARRPLARPDVPTEAPPKPEQDEQHKGITVYQLAREASVDFREVVELCDAAGIEDKHMSSTHLSSPDIGRLKAHVSNMENGSSLFDKLMKSPTFRLATPLRHPVIKVAPMPPVRQPAPTSTHAADGAAGSAPEPKAQKPEIRLPRDAILRAGERPSLKTLVARAATPPHVQESDSSETPLATTSADSQPASGESEVSPPSRLDPALPRSGAPEPTLVADVSPTRPDTVTDRSEPSATARSLIAPSTAVDTSGITTPPLTQDAVGGESSPAPGSPSQDERPSAIPIEGTATDEPNLRSSGAPTKPSGLETDIFEETRTEGTASEQRDREGESTLAADESTPSEVAPPTVTVTEPHAAGASPLTPAQVEEPPRPEPPPEPGGRGQAAQSPTATEPAQDAPDTRGLGGGDAHIRSEVAGAEAHSLTDSLGPGFDPARSEVVREASEEPCDVPQAALTVEAFRSVGFFLSAETLERLKVSLLQGRHLLLCGPPGSGKTELAKAIPSLLFRDRHAPYLLATAHASWTSYDILGGPSLINGSVHFHPGAFTEAALRCQDSNGRYWLIIDEINRCDIDRVLGPVFTTLQDFVLRLPSLSGQSPEVAIPRLFRVIATMNTADKNALFPLSVALMRRFAIIDVPPLLDAEAEREMLLSRLDGFLRTCGLPAARNGSDVLHGSTFSKFVADVQGLFSKLRAAATPLNQAQVPELLVGSSTVLEVCKYVLLGILIRQSRTVPPPVVDDAISVNFLPQLEGLDHGELRIVKQVFENCPWALSTCVAVLSNWEAQRAARV